jgi:putative transposase
VSVAAVIASQRTEHDVPHAVACRVLGVWQSWFYKWRDRPPTPRADRRGWLAGAVRKVFDDSGGTYGSPRIGIELRAQGWRVFDNTVAALMVEPGLVARVKRRRRGLTRQGRRSVAPDLVKRAFTAPAPDVAWCGDMTEIATGEGKLYLATVIDLYSRRILGYAMGEHHDAGLVVAVLNMAAVTRGGLAGVIFHSDRRSEYTSADFARACAVEGPPVEARLRIATWITDFYNRRRRHSVCDGHSPIDYERSAARAMEAQAA